jgi:hypothetical protein
MWEKGSGANTPAMSKHDSLAANAQTKAFKQQAALPHTPQMAGGLAARVSRI